MQIVDPSAQPSAPDVRSKIENSQLPRERDPHKAPKLGIPPGAVSPAMCRRLSGHAILCSQGKWGRGGQPSADALGSLCPVRGCVEPSITLSEAACRWRHVRVLEVKIYYFFTYIVTEHWGTPAVLHFKSKNPLG